MRTEENNAVSTRLVRVLSTSSEVSGAPGLSASRRRTKASVTRSSPLIATAPTRAAGPGSSLTATAVGRGARAQHGRGWRRLLGALPQLRHLLDGVDRGRVGAARDGDDVARLRRLAAERHEQGHEIGCEPTRGYPDPHMGLTRGSGD